MKVTAPEVLTPVTVAVNVTAWLTLAELGWVVKERYC